MKIKAGKMYVIEESFSTHVVLIEENKLPSYKFSAKACWKLVDGKLVEETNRGYFKEVWLESGIAYHYDCRLDLVREYIGNGV